MALQRDGREGIWVEEVELMEAERVELWVEVVMAG
jgi:hypothetical protein